MAKATFNENKVMCARKMDENLRKKLVEFYISIVVLYGDEIWTLSQVNQNYLKNFEFWFWRRMEISWSDRVRNEVLHTVKQEINILHTIERRNANWIGDIFCRICVLRHVIE